MKVFDWNHFESREKKVLILRMKENKNIKNHKKGLILLMKFVNLYIMFLVGKLKRKPHLVW